MIAIKTKYHGKYLFGFCSKVIEFRKETKYPGNNPVVYEIVKCEIMFVTV